VRAPVQIDLPLSAKSRVSLWQSATLFATFSNHKVLRSIGSHTKIVYRIDEHDDGWAYQVDGVFSETFSSHDAARRAAQRAAAEQHMPGETRSISWEDEKGKWHEEVARGDDRPDAEVEG